MFAHVGVLIEASGTLENLVGMARSRLEAPGACTHPGHHRCFLPCAQGLWAKYLQAFSLQPAELRDGHQGTAVHSPVQASCSGLCARACHASQLYTSS